MPDDGAGDYSSIENLVGTKFNEWLAGDAGNNQLEGRRGNDWISGGGAEDTLFGGDEPHVYKVGALGHAVAIALDAGEPGALPNGVVAEMIEKGAAEPRVGNNPR